MSQVLHIFTDEKWTNNIVKQFIDSGAQDQEFVVLFEHNIENPNYRLKEDLPLIKIIIGSKEYSELISNINNYSSIFIHYLCDLKLDLIENVVKPTKLVWMCWGQDIHKMIIANSYMPRTRKLIWKNGLKHEYFWKYSLWLRQLKYPFTRRGKILSKFNYCCPVIYSDLYKTNKYLNLNIEYLPFHYSSLEDLLGTFINSKTNGKNILIGNSSSYASNHLDVFEKLVPFDIGNRKIIVPLNYGDMEYGDQIENAGIELFGNNFEALRSYLDSDVYSSYIQSCSAAIFNHRRQQALGNILICLWLGIRVYLNERGPLFDYLKSLDLPVFSIQSDLNISNDAVFDRIDEKKHMKTKKILMAEFGSEKTKLLTQNVFKELNKI